LPAGAKMLAAPWRSCFFQWATRLTWIWKWAAI
jgi:hypothetical protein